LILYDKSGLFLGMGNQELYLLGYEDMEEFRNYHSDIADLFVNKPGFIFKFKNFCWIDYAQHSGTPNKRVLIRTKNGKEIESSLLINEVYLQKEINGTSLFYSVELSNAPSFKRDLPISSTLPSQNFEPSAFEEDAPTLPSYETSFAEDIPSTFLSDTPTETSSPTRASSFEEEYSLPLPTPMISLPEEEKTQDFTLNTSAPLLEDTFDFKLKFDHTILEEPKTEPEPVAEETPDAYNSIDQITIHDLDFVAPVEAYPDDKIEDLLEDTTLHVNVLKAEPTLLDETFDLCECAEALGLDISTLAQIIEEYVNALNTSMPLLEKAINDNNRTSAKEEIATLRSIALHLHIESLFHHFEHLESSLAFDTKEEILHTLEALKKAVEAFKESVL